MKIAKKLVIMLLLVTIIVSMLPVSTTANGTIAWGAANISGSGVRVRSGPGLEHAVLTHVNSGDIVVVVERTNSEWNMVNFHGTVGYISVPFLDNRREAANFNKLGSIAGNGVNMRERPDTTSTVLSSHNTGTEMTIIGINNGWYKVEHGSQTGYIRSDLMTVLSQGSGSSGGVTASSRPSVPDATLSLGQQIADFAASFAGHRYVWGGTSPSGFDCSGLVTYVMRQYGISVTRTASGQFRDNGVSVSKSELIPGDLVFFSRNGHSVTHVGIFIGNGRFVHASGTRVGVIISDINSSYYTRVWFGAKRVI